MFKCRQSVSITYCCVEKTNDKQQLEAIMNDKTASEWFGVPLRNERRQRVRLRLVCTVQAQDQPKAQAPCRWQQPLSTPITMVAMVIQPNYN